MSDASFSLMFLLDIFSLNTVLNLGHELHGIVLENHGVAMGHVF